MGFMYFSEIYLKWHLSILYLYLEKSKGESHFSVLQGIQSPSPFPLVLRVHVRVRAVPILVLIEG